MNQKSKKDSEQWRSQGRGPGGPAPLIFRPKNIFFLRPGPPAYLRGLDDPPPPPLSEGLDPPLLREKLQLIDMRKHTTAAHS